MKAKRILDIVFAGTALVPAVPVLAAACAAIYAYDRRNPVYSATRVGWNGVIFRMYKLRSMVVDADKSSVDTAGNDDPRVTPPGRFLRRWKFDELPQLWNVLRGDMSLVGPRPQIEREVNLYTDVERGLLAVRPGITDFSSIVFSDLAGIAGAHPDPDIAYGQLVRPWKSRLGLFYIAHMSIMLDLALVLLTAVAFVSRQSARRGVALLLSCYNTPPEMIEVCLRRSTLLPTPPPGSTQVVASR
ncbi:MAG: sugar transferase [Pseudomonadota bacterium]|nr:sugar transferase [Pseudomonadota bacterium]MDE3038792.1 sugar transferase [Pseudomonadota bacterium]